MLEQFRQAVAAKPDCIEIMGHPGNNAFEPLVKQAIVEKKLPGAVVLIGRGDRTIYQKAIGNRALLPGVEPMTLDTIFGQQLSVDVTAPATPVHLHTASA